MPTKILIGFLKWLSQIAEKWWGQLFLIGLPIFILLWPVLVGGQIFFSGDMTAYEYPIFFWYHQALTSGQSILLNSQILSGFPVFASAPGGFLSPINLLVFKFLDVFAAYHWLIFLNLLLAGFFTARLLKELNLKSLPAIIGGLVYVFSQWTLAEQMAIINGLPLLPLIFWLLLIIYKKDNWWPAVLGTFIVALLWFSVHYNWSVIILFGSGLFVLFLAWQKRPDFKKIFKLFLKYLIMVGGGTLLGLLQLLPALAVLASSSRGAGFNYQEATVGVAKLADILTFLSPNFYLPILSGDGQFYLGILPLFLILFAIVLKNNFSRFFSWLFILSMILAIQYSPLYWILQKLPGFTYFRAPTRWLFLGYFGASLAVGFGVEHLLESGYEKWKNFLVKIFKLGLIVLAGISFLIYLVFVFFGDRILSLLKSYFDQKIYPRTSGLPIEHYHAIIEGFFADTKKLFDFLNPGFFLPAIFFVASFLVVIYFYQQKKQPQYFFPVALLLISLNFIFVFYGYFKFLPAKTTEYQPKIAELAAFSNDRVFSFLPGFTEFEKINVPYKPESQESFIFQAEILAPNVSLLYGINDIDGYENLMPQRYSEILALIGSDRAVFGEKLSDQDLPLAEKIKLFINRHSLLDLLGVRYVISAYAFDTPELTKISEQKITKYQIPLYIYENKNFLPLVYLAKEVKYLDNNQPDNFKIITKPDNDFSQNTFIECSNCVNQTGGSGQVKIISQKNGYLSLEVNMVNDSWLIFSQSNLPGWQATINGQPAKIYPANYLFQGVSVPAGEHNIIFSYNYFDLINYGRRN